MLHHDPSIDDPKLRYVMEHIDLGVWDYDTVSNTFTVSDAWRQMRGVDRAEQINVPNDEWLNSVHPDDREKLKAVFRGQVEGNSKSIVIQYRHRHKEGHWVWILCRASVMATDDEGRPLKIVGTDTDVTHVKARENDLRELTGKLQLAIAASGMGIWEFDPCTSQVHWDDKLLEIYGITDGQNVRSEDLWETYIHPDDLAKTVAHTEACRKSESDINCDFRIVRPDGSIRHVRSLARSVARPNAESKLIGVNIDVSEDYFRTQELELARRQLEHDSRHDALTGLGNRRKLNEMTLDLFNRLGRTDAYVVMHIDLDHFKRVNDTLGHAAGDHVLAVVARKLMDLCEDTADVFRVGGDEFTVVFETRPSDQELERICEAMIRSLSEPARFEGNDCTIGASIGYAVGQGPPVNTSEIFVNADTALYAAKYAGRSCFRAYSREMEAAFCQFENARQDLIDAMANGQIICYFQPQYDAHTLEVVGAEALVRWRCPDKGLLTPDKFLPQAIEADLLPDIDEHVLRYVTQTQDEWAAQGLLYPRISVNISKARLDADSLVEQTRDVLQNHHLITFELLETAFLDRIDTQLAFKLDALRDMGIRIELDDFGSGHSSIAAMQVVKPDGVKIDRSLVEPLTTKPSQLLTLRSLAKIARLEGAAITVEGLETGIQLAAIRDLDCDALQGYTLQRPMPAIEFAALLAKNGMCQQQA